MGPISVRVGLPQKYFTGFLFRRLPGFLVDDDFGRFQNGRYK
jgi:hypothetical protein